MYNNRCRANSDPTVSYIIVRLYLTAIVSIELQESLDAFNDWFQHFHHNIPVSQMFCSCLFFAGFQIDMRFLQIVFFLGMFCFFFGQPRPHDGAHANFTEKVAYEQRLEQYEVL